MILAVLHHPDFEHYDLSSVRVVGSGGALVPVPLMEEVQARLGADVIISFGQTEGTCAITHTLPNDSFELKASEAEVSEAELRTYCQSQISHQKVPRYFHFVESYPMTGSGKVQKFLLREQAITSLGLSPTKPPPA